MTDNKVQENEIEPKLNTRKHNLNEKEDDIKNDKENGADDWDSIYDESGESIIKQFEKVNNIGDEGN
jgi:hypothetical protein